MSRAHDTTTPSILQKGGKAQHFLANFKLCAFLLRAVTKDSASHTKGPHSYDRNPLLSAEIEGEPESYR